MKKIFAVALVLVLALSLLTACGGNDKGNSGNNSTNPPASQGGNNNGETGTGQASITPASGWEKDASVPYPEYKKDGAKFTVYNKAYPNSYPAEIDTIEQFAEYILGTLKSSFEGATFEDIKSDTVGGRKAQCITYTFFGTTDTTFYMMMDDGYVYSVGYSYEEGGYDAVKGDIQSMLDSYTIK
jgi:hypothetical protein